MIASPSDITKEREIVTQEIHRWNDVVLPLVSKGLITNEVEITHGASTVTVNIAMINILTTELFPRKDEHQAPAFGGI